MLDLTCQQMRKTSMGVRADSSQGSVEGGNLKAKDPKDPEDHGSDGSRTCFRPKRIVLIRHGESEGNVDELAYCSACSAHTAGLARRVV